MDEDMKGRLRALLDRPADTLDEADIVAEAARLLRDQLRLEEQADELLARATGSPRDQVSEAPARYESGLAGVPLHEAARRVLAAAGEPLHVSELGARIKAGGWRHPRARRPQPDQIEFQLAGRLPRFPDTFRRVAPNTFGLAEWGGVVRASRAVPRVRAVRGRGPRLARAIGDDPDQVHGEAPAWRSS